MSKIQTVDPYLPVYEFEKAQNADFNYGLKPVRKRDVEMVDKILELAGGSLRESVTTESDWIVVKELFKLWATTYPQEWREFKESIDLIRQSRNPNAKSQSGEIMYVGSLPFRFERLIKTMFPYQQFNKAFVWKLVTKMSIFKVTGEKN